MRIVLALFALSLTAPVLTLAKETEKRTPASAESIIWEVRREIPTGKVCPSQAARYDAIAYQVNGDGGYVCFSCDYVDSTPLLVVTDQTRCPKDIKCSKGKCK